jgi:glyoxylase-like metal-dependent hydrolase (beta-lactamase superfamily II)
MTLRDQERSLEVKVYQTAGGAQVFQIPLQEFPILWGNVYLVLFDSAEGVPYRVLIDTGSGIGDSNDHLIHGLASVSTLTGTPISLSDLTHVFITHGHIDHFGGLTFVRPQTQARLGVHELDLRNLTNYEERLTLVAWRLEEFLREGGLDVDQRARVIELYKITKSMFRSVGVDFTYEACGMRVGPFEILHVPGHCAGHVVIRLHDVLFSGDHILAHTSPHQSPEHLTMFTGLEHYLQSLDTLDAWSGGIRLTFGGHEDPITDLKARIQQIRSLHQQRLGKVLGFLEQPHTVLEVSKELFGEVHGYNVLLALEEAGAHIEYLYQRGLLEIQNLAELERTNGNAPLHYRRLADIGCQPPGG